MDNQLQPLGLPESYSTDNYVPEVGAPASEVRNPSAMLSLAGTTYGALGEGASATIGEFLDTKTGLQSFNAGIAPKLVERPKLPQEKVNQLWAENGITDSPPDASGYNDVSIYYLLDGAKRHQAMKDIDEATDYSVTGTPIRAVAGLAAGMLDPINLAAGLFPAAKIAGAVGAKGVAAGLEGLAATASSASASLVERVGARAAVGAVEGAVGNIPLEAITAPMRSELGQDYTANDSLQNILMGSVIGGGLHVVAGGLGRLRTSETTPVATNESLINSTHPDVAVLRDKLTTLENKPGEVASADLRSAVDLLVSKKTEVKPEGEVAADTIAKSQDDLTTTVQDDVIKTNEASDNIATQLETPVKTIEPTVQTLADFIDQPLTTGRMIDNVLNEYNARVSNLEIAARTPEKKLQVLKESIAKQEPSVGELAERATPETREAVNKSAIVALDNDQYPMVEALLKSDENIKGATIKDAVNEVRNKINDPENSYITDMLPEKPRLDTPVLFEEQLNYKAESTKIDSKIAEIEKLSELGLYSKVESVDRLKARQEQLTKDLSNITDYKEWATKHKELTNVLNKIDQAAGIDREKITTTKTFDAPYYSKMKASIGDNPGLQTKRIVDELVSAFGNDTNKLLESGKIKIVESVKDLPGKHEGKVQGLSKDGQIWLVAENLTPQRAKAVALHEGTHVNMTELVGEKGYANLLDQAKRLLDDNEDIAKLANEAIPEDTPAWARDHELLAYIVENVPTAPFVKELIAKFRAWLYKSFPSLRNSMELSSYDIHQLAIMNLRNYAKSADIKGEGILYSHAKTPEETLAEVATQAQDELEAINQSFKKVDTFRTALSENILLFDYVDDKPLFTEQLRNTLGINKEDAKDFYNDLSAAYKRAVENGEANPNITAINYSMDKLEYGLKAHKLALIHDKALVSKHIASITNNFVGFEKDGLNSKLVGTLLQHKGARADNVGAEIVNMQRKHLGHFDADLRAAGLYDQFNKGIYNNDIMRAMEALENNADVSTLPKEAVTLAKIIQNSYDNITADMNNNGLMINKVKNYFANQQNMHDQLKIRAAGFEAWRKTVAETLDFKATAEAMNISPSDIDDTLLRGIYDGLATGEHIGGSGNYGAAYNGTSFKSIRNKQRVLHFKGAEGVIKYREAFAARDFQASVIGTIEGNTKKLGMIKVLGVNYERNMKDIASKVIETLPDSDSRSKLRSWADSNMMNQLKSIDGRSDRPGNETFARWSSNVRAVKSMASLGFATVSAITDVVNAAAFLNRRGMGRGLVVDSITSLGEIFHAYSPERKQMLSAMGVFSDSVLKNTYRDGTAENSTGKFLAKKQSQFFRFTGLDQWTNSIRLNAMDSLMSYMSKEVDKDFGSLNKGLRDSFGLFGIDQDQWDFIRSQKTKAVDGNTYLTVDALDDLKDQAMAKFSNLEPELQTRAAMKYIENTKRNLYNYFMDGLSHMVIEPDAATKYYQTGGGLQAGTVSGEVAKFMMQFKSFSVGFMRKILFDQMYEGHDTIWGKGGYARSWGLKGLSENGFMQTDIGKKVGLVKYMVGLTVAGYVAGVIKDILKGKEPRPLFDKDGSMNKATLTAAFLQGGSLGIYGDFLFGNTNRFGGGPLETAAGPVIGGTISDLDNLRKDILDVGSKRYGKVIAQDSLKFAMSNTPFVNSFYTSAAFNYLFVYGLQDALNPGALRRMERNMKQNNNQEFMFPPSRYAVRY